MNIYEAYELALDVARKNNNGDLTPDRFNRLAEQAQLSVFMNRYGNPSLYQPGRPIPLMAYPMTQKISDDLLPFLTVDKEITLTDGVGDVPDDYLHLDILTLEDGTNIDVLMHNKFKLRAKSHVVGPGDTYPIGNLYYNGQKKVKVLPKTVSKCYMSYLRIPKAPKFAYEGDLIYNPALSVDFEMPVDTHLEIVLIILQFYGVMIDNNTLLQFSLTKQSA